MILPPLPDDLPFSEEDDFTGMDPRCEECLVTMEPKNNRWVCPQCGASKLS